jgi:transcription initiation factor IIE alpha subunit
MDNRQGNGIDVDGFLSECEEVFTYFDKQREEQGISPCCRSGLDDMDIDKICEEGFKQFERTFPELFDALLGDVPVYRG